MNAHLKSEGRKKKGSFKKKRERTSAMNRKQLQIW